MKRRSFQLAALSAFGSGLGGCASLVLAPEVTALSQIDAATVLVVGRIELVPALEAREQHLEMTSLGGSWDPFDQRKHLAGRIVLALGEQPLPSEGFTSDMMNPRVQETFFLRLPKRKPYVVRGAITMQMTVSASATSASARTHELRVPVPIALGLRADDRAVYVGTWRLHRDEFHSVHRVEVLDHQREAAAEARRRFGSELPMRKSLARFVAAQGA